MKTKIVIWGTNEKEEKILLGIELIETENKVRIFVFPEAEAKEDFYNLMINDWRIGNAVVFPENHQVIDRALSVTESLLPDTIKVSRTDVVNRAKAEWHFVVLSAKLYEAYNSELSEIKEKVSNIEVFDKNVWEELKGFWQKVQAQLYDKNIFREHAKELQDETNKLFDQLKGLRKKYDDKFREESKGKAADFHEKLDKIREKFSEGFGLQPLWNEMKSIQNKFRDERLAKQERNEIWNKIDALFKDIKEKKYGSKGEGSKSNALERIENRYKGLLSAIKKMENSIRWDRKDMKFQSDRAEGTFGQLEQELRGAKMKMIEERVNSKEMKLAEMVKTKEMLEGKIENEKEKVRKQEEAQKIKEKQEELKAKVKNEIREKNKILEEKMGGALAAAAASTDSKDASPKQVEISETVPAVEPKNEVLKASVLEDDSSSKVKDKEVEKVATVEPQVSESDAEAEAISAPPAAEAEEDDRSIGDKVQDVAEDIVDSIKAAGAVLGDRISEVIDNITEEE